MSEIKGRHVSVATGREYAYVCTVRPRSTEIWSAHVFRDNRLECVLARGLVDPEINALDVNEHVRSLVVSYIDALR